MITLHSEVSIDRPPDVVFKYLIEPAKQAIWSDVPMRQLTEGPLRTGSRFEVTFGMGPVKATVGLDMSAVDEDRRVAFSSFSGPIGWQGEYRLEPNASGPNGTVLRQEGVLVFKGLWRLIEPFVGREISGGEIREPERLKAVIESAEAPDTSAST